uniref:MARCO like n=1 Tax=Oryctolagus cuniculus TaxID=9986 RepID=A0A5F9DNU5_RABIT
MGIHHEFCKAASEAHGEARGTGTLVWVFGSSTQISKPIVFKPEGNQEPQLFLEKKNDLNPPNKQGGSYEQGKPGTLNLQGQPGYSNQPGKPGYFNQHERPEVLNQPGTSETWILKGNSGEYNQKGNTEASNKQGNSGSFHQVGKPGSSSQPGKPGSSSQPGKPGSSSQPGKPGSSSQQGKPGSSSQHRQSRSFYNQEESKNAEGPLNGNIKKTQVSVTTSSIHLSALYFVRTEMADQIHCLHEQQFTVILIKQNELCRKLHEASIPVAKNTE